MCLVRTYHHPMMPCKGCRNNVLGSWRNVIQSNCFDIFQEFLDGFPAMSWKLNHWGLKFRNGGSTSVTQNIYHMKIYFMMNLMILIGILDVDRFYYKLSQNLYGLTLIFFLSTLSFDECCLDTGVFQSIYCQILLQTNVITCTGRWVPFLVKI